MTTDNLLDDILAKPLARSLRDLPRGRPLAEQRRIVERAIARSRASGLVLPRVPEPIWVAGTRDVQLGETNCPPLRWLLQVDQWPHELEGTTFHELKHVSDYHLGLRLSRVVMERRAIAYASRMMGWA